MPIDPYKISRMTEQQKDALPDVPPNELAFFHSFINLRRLTISFSIITNIPPLILIIVGAYFFTAKEASRRNIVPSLVFIIAGTLTTIIKPYMFFLTPKKTKMKPYSGKNNKTIIERNQLTQRRLSA